MRKYIDGIGLGVKSLELDLSVARSASSKLDQMLSVQKSSSDKTGLGYVDSICVSAPHSTKFVPSSSSSEPSVSEIVSETVKPPVSEVAKPLEGSSSRKIRVDLKESKPKKPTLSKDKTHDKPAWVCHFCGKTGHIRPNCYKLQAAKRANKPKVPVPQALDPMVLIGDLVKALNLYSNPGVGNHSQVNKNSNALVHLKSFGCKRLDLTESF
uniref:CCHC-type domain-containing protein n=1 Tax=Quercus lobata TaxID=97700 RepID=A0A7N2LFB6_QUELO